MNWKAEMGEEEEKPEHLLIWVIFVLISLVIRVVFGPFLFPFPSVVDWITGGLLLLLGMVIWWRWSRLWQGKMRGQLVTDGLYRYVRHPHYLSIIVMSLGVSFLMQSLILLLFTFLTSIALYHEARKEEELLIRTYGEEYREYMERVHWRFIPGVI